MLNRRQFHRLLVAGAASTGLPLLPYHLGLAQANEPELNDDGLYSQDWFLDSFLDLGEDLVEAAEAGKHFAVLWEQRGCPYCRELHRVNFAREDVRSYVEQNFTILQLNLWGSREVTDFDGEALEERDAARKWRVNFTPTIMFFPDALSLVEGKPAMQAELVRMPGYLKPFHFLSMFEFVREGHHKEMGFQRFLQNKFAALEAQGIDPDVW